MSRQETRTGGRPARTGVIPGDFALSVGKPDKPEPPGWKWTLLTDVARLETGHTPSRKNPEYWGGAVPWVGIKDATDNHGRMIIDTYQFTNDLGIANSSARILPAYTVCLSRTASVGYVVVMGRPMATSQDFVNWVCSKAIDHRFLKYVLLAERNAFLRFASGTTHQTIYFPEVKAFHVCLPPIGEQLAITHILGNLDDKIELNRRMNATLETLARAIFKSWFVEFEPVRAKAEGRAPEGLAPEIAALFPEGFEDSELGEIPAGWKAGSVTELATLSRDSVTPTQFPDEIFEHFSIPAFDNNKAPVFEKGDEIKSNKFVVAPDSVLISKLNPRIPRIWLPHAKAGFRAICSTEFLVTRPKKQIPREFLFSLLSNEDFNTTFATFVTGTSGSHQRVKPENLLQMEVVIPPFPILNAYARTVAPLIKKIELNGTESRTLAALRDTLLPRLLSGELRVKDAGHRVEAAA